MSHGRVRLLRNNEQTAAKSRLLRFTIQNTLLVAEGKGLIQNLSNVMLS